MGTGGGLTVIDFSEQGNSAFFRGEGWSAQEPDRVWAIGPCSVLRVPFQPCGRTMVLEAEIGPLQLPPVITGQIVRIRVNGNAIGGVRLALRSLIRFEIDPGLIRPDGVQEITFEFPGFCRPASVGQSTDDRPLSAWFSFIRLYTTDMFKPGPWFPASQPEIPVIGLAPPVAEARDGEPGPDAIYTFGPEGTAVQFLRDGWDAGEDNFTWTVAAVSDLVLPAPRTPGPHALRLDAKPLTVPGAVPRQNVTVVLDGIAIGQLVMREAACWLLPLPVELTGGPNVLALSFILPDAWRCSDFGPSRDTRSLGIAVSRISIIPMTSQALLGAAIRAEQAGQLMPIAISREFLTEGPGSHLAAIEASLGVGAVTLARGFESLGTDREFGMIQRKLGTDPFNLFRFCEGTPSDLVRALTHRLEALSEPDEITVSPAGDAGQDFVLAVSKYGLRWREPFAIGGDGQKTTLRDRAITLGYLRRKFFEGLATGRKIYVLKYRRAIPIELAAAVLIELNRHGHATLLCVQPASGGRRPGEVELIAPGLMRGYVDQAGQGLDVGCADPASWLPVLANAALLHRQARAR